MCLVGLRKYIKIIRYNLCNEDERQYLQMMQNNVERMSAHCAKCKS